MYTDDDLNRAVEKGIFTENDVDRFRAEIARISNSPRVDEENFRLLSGFNDIFVVIACILSLSSAAWAGHALGESVSYAVIPVLSWLLAEFFVRKRKMALPAIILLIAFVGGVFLTAQSFMAGIEMGPAFAAAIATLAAYIHWRRFMVPITIAAGAAAAAACVIITVISQTPLQANFILASIFIAGLATFVLAMFWDTKDLNRTSRNSDVAFWLHLLAAPMIVHPIFSKLGILGGKEDLFNMVIIVLLYISMTAISLIIDRRAFMVSSLLYVLYALSNLFSSYGMVSYSFALTGLCIGGALLLLSAFWQKVRQVLVAALPKSIASKVPAIQQSL